MAHTGEKGDFHAGLWWGNIWERYHLEGLDIDERIILKWMFSKWDGGIDWIDLTHDMDRWQSLL